jgi:hypothetical protein
MELLRGYLKICNPPSPPFSKGGLEVVRDLEKGKRITGQLEFVKSDC